MVYLISYDPNQQKDPTKLTSHLQRHFPAFSRVLPSQYLVRSDATALAILLDLTKHAGVQAGLLVSEVTQSLAWHGLRIDEAAMEAWEAQAHDCG